MTLGKPSGAGDTAQALFDAAVTGVGLAGLAAIAFCVPIASDLPLNFHPATIRVGAFDEALENGGPGPELVSDGV